MINAIIKGIFNLILSLFNAIFSPIISSVMKLFPDVATIFNRVTNSLILKQGLSFLSIAVDLLLIPRPALWILFDYFAVKYSIYLLSISVKFVVTVYNKFKI